MQTYTNALPVRSRIAATQAPTLFRTAGRKAEKHFWEFFGASIRNKNTRQAYLTAVFQFADWLEHHRVLDLDVVEPLMIAGYIEELGELRSPATVKQHLAAIRMLFDWLVVHQVLPTNPASPVRGPKHVVKTGKTPVLMPEDIQALFDVIETDTLVGLRDRALIGVMVYSFARVSAAVKMRVADYYTQGKRSFFKLHEKGGKYNQVPAHHVAQEYLDAYIEAAFLEDDPKGPLFRSSGQGRNKDALLRRALSRESALQMIKRRVKAAGLPYEICCHSFRGTGITAYLSNGGSLEIAARIAGHESTRTTQLYDRTDDDISLDEIERIHL